MSSFNLNAINSAFDSNMNSIGAEIASLSNLSDPSEADVQKLIDDQKRWADLTKLKAFSNSQFFKVLDFIIQSG